MTNEQLQNTAELLADLVNAAFENGLLDDEQYCEALEFIESAHMEIWRSLNNGE